MLFLSAAILLAAAQQPWTALPSLAPEALQKELTFFADDRFEGRRTGEFGGQAAGAYIRARFTRFGLQPLGGSWMHEFPARELHLDTKRTYLQVGKKRVDCGFDFLPHPTSVDCDLTAPVVFVGYGLHAPDYDYDDFAGVDLHGKIALLFRWEPQVSDPNSKLQGTRMLPQSTLAAKVRECRKRGAIAVLAATPPDPEQKPKAPSRPFWPSFSTMYQAMAGPAAANMFPADELASTNFTTEDVVAQMFTILQNANPLGSDIGVGYLSPRMARALFRKAGRDTKVWVEQNNQDLQPASFEIPLQVRVSIRKMPSALVGRNVVGVLQGSDKELRKEYVVIGAHYDHVGMNDKGEIWNGADDNGSGSVALMGLAQAFAELPVEQRPKRSLVFVAFSGEELGLIGSYYFLVQDLIPVKDIVAMVNTDMIGRSVDHSLYAVGAKSAPALRGIVEQAAQGLDLQVRFDNDEFFDRSDQVGFYYSGIPIMFFNTDEHEDYHRPSDTADKILYQDMARISVLTYRTVQTLANRAERLHFVDAYGRLLPNYGVAAVLPIPFPVSWADRLDY